MKKILPRLALALLFSASSYGLFAARTTYAQCGCSCSYVCSGTCNVSCSGCTISGAVDTALQCCEQERRNVEPHCVAGGPVN